VVSELPSYPHEPAQREAAEGPLEEHGRYASWGRRAAAYLLDTLIVIAIVAAALGLGFGVAAVGGRCRLLLLLAILSVIGVPIFYYVYFVGKSGQTWARRWLDIRVQHARTGQPIGYGTRRCTTRSCRVSSSASEAGAVLAGDDERAAAQQRAEPARRESAVSGPDVPPVKTWTQTLALAAVDPRLRDLKTRARRPGAEHPSRPDEDDVVVARSGAWDRRG
jgi:hypothetical protein